MKRFTVGNITRGYLNPTVAQRLHSNSLIALKPSTAPKPTYDPVKEYKKAFYALANAPSRNRAEEEDLLKSYYKSMVDKMAETNKAKKKKSLWARMKSMVWAEPEEEEAPANPSHVEHIGYDEFVAPDHQPPVREIIYPRPPPHPVFGTIPDKWGQNNERDFVRIEPIRGSNIPAVLHVPYDDVSAEIAQYDRMYHTGQIDETDRAAALVQAAKHTFPARTWINPLRDDYNPYAPYASSIPYYYRDPSQRAAAAAAVAAADGVAIPDDVVLYDEQHLPPAPPPPPPPPPGQPVPYEQKALVIVKGKKIEKQGPDQGDLAKAALDMFKQRKKNKTTVDIDAELAKDKEERKRLAEGTKELWTHPLLKGKNQEEEEEEENDGAIKLGRVRTDKEEAEEREQKEAEAAAKALDEGVKEDMGAFVKLLGSSEEDVKQIRKDIEPKSYNDFANYLREAGLKTVDALPEIIPAESKILRQQAIDVGFKMLNAVHNVLEKRDQLRLTKKDLSLKSVFKKHQAEVQENVKDLKQLVADLKQVSDDLKGFQSIDEMKALYETAEGLLLRIRNRCNVSEFNPGKDVVPNVLFDEQTRKEILEAGIARRAKENEMERYLKQNVESVLPPSPPNKPLPKKPPTKKLPELPKTGSGSFGGFSLPLKRRRYSYF